MGIHHVCYLRNAERFSLGGSVSPFQTCARAYRLRLRDAISRLRLNAFFCSLADHGRPKASPVESDARTASRSKSAMPEIPLRRVLFFAKALGARRVLTSLFF